ncbi:hypothetical protein BBJ28_00007340 [Nothophytophthora sp. Chile5]|nr:hypothetical protein BBJ28_00007340 [Nothophytophthora sp. Chile5]
MREQILDRIVNTIIVQKDGTKTALLLLSRLIKRNPLGIDGKLEARIHECLEYVIHMKPENAQVLFSALSPLLKARASMKNFVILTLRKAMFRKDEASRMIAIQGFSFMLCLSSQIFSGRATLTQLYSQNTGHLLSQGVGVVGSSHPNGLENEHDLASQDQANAIVAEDLFRQFCGIFKRALQLQTDVRLSLYAELLRVFRQCPTLQPSILELVFQHYLKYYNANESVLPPLKVDSCLAHKRGAYEEPMAYLVHVMLACVGELRQANAQGDDDMMIDDIIPATQTASAQKSFGEVDRNVTVLMERLKRCELSDFELDKSSSFSSSTDSGATNMQIGKILLSVWETCMNWTITSSDGLEIHDSTWVTLIHYMHLHHWITEKLDESASSTKASDSSERKRGRPPGKGKKAPAKGSERAPGPHASASDKSDRAVVFAEHADLKDALLLAPSSVAAFLASALGKIQAVPLELSAEEEALISFMVHQVRQTLDVVLSRSVGDFDLMVLGTSLSPEAKGLVDRLGPSLLGLFCAFHDRDSAEPTPVLKKDDPHERSRRIRCESLRLFVRIVRLWVTRSIEEAADCISRALRLSETHDYSDLVGDSAASQLESCVAIFLRLFDDLCEKTLLEEAAVVLEIIEAIWSKLPSKNMRKYEAWMKTALTRRNFPMQQRLVENMVRLFLQPHPDLALQSPFALQLANGLLFIHSAGKPSKVDEAPTVNIRDRLNLSKLDEKNIVAVAGAVLSKVERAIAELDANIKTFNSQHVRAKHTEQDAIMLQTLEDETGTAVLGSLHASSASNATYKDLCLQLYLHSGTMTPFTMMNLGKAALCSRILRLFSRLYKLLGVVITWRVRRKEASFPKFLAKLLNRTARDLSPMVLNFIGVIIDTEGEAENKPGIAASVQAKLIPDVVFQMEQYDVALIKFSKLCKVGERFGVRLGCHAGCIRLSRDFRFKEDLVKQKFEGEGDGDEQEKHTEDGEEEGSAAEGGDADDSDDAETESAEDEDYPPTATAPADADADAQDESGPASKRARPSSTPT